MDQTKLGSKAASAIRLASRSSFRSVARSSLMLRKQLWIWPILAALLLGACGWWVSRSVEDAMRLRRTTELSTILDADVSAMRIWMSQQSINAELIADDDELLALTQQLVEAAAGAPENRERALLDSKAQAAVRKRLGSQLRMCDYSGFFLVSPNSVVLAADQDAPVGKVLDGYRKEFFAGALAGNAAVSKPYRSPLLLTNEDGQLKANLPTMFAAAAVRDNQGQPVAILGVRIRPEIDFTGILQVARSGATGETYAFDRSGLLLSESRFDLDLKQIGLLADNSESQSVLTLELRDPGVDMTQGQRPPQRRAEQPLTRLAAAAVAGESGVDVMGYRDYRGVPVIGAWTWLKEYDFGIGTEQDVAEAFRPLYVLRRAFWGMFALLFLSAAAIFVFTIVVARANREARRAALVAKRLGQYTLDEKLGEGGMGVVYRAHHAMLQRPTAVKLLGAEKTTEQTLARFEREVQITSRLNHPNTIAIYDYGRTPEGIFYYAMEYLEGVNLEELVRWHGPQPEGRVIFILQQVCGSLAEAHSIGLIHRDIKPANIILTQRGGIYDFAKLLDFGLVKALDSKKDSSLTSAGSLTGTPLYMAPEAIQHDPIDARSDLYALGAVGYYLLTGTPVFDGTHVIEILKKHIDQPPDLPSVRLGKPVSKELEAVLLKCLAKNMSDRPSGALEIAEELARCPSAGSWTRKDAAAWWQKYFPRAELATTKPDTESTNFAATQDISGVKTR